MLAYRYLFAQLVSRELRRKYKGSTLGVLWYLVNPLVLLGAYTLMFGHVLQGPEDPRLPDIRDDRARGVDLLSAVAAGRRRIADRSGRAGAQGALSPPDDPRRDASPCSSSRFWRILVLLTPVALALRGDAQAPALLLLPVLMVLLFGFVLGCALIVAVLHAYFRDVAPILTAALLPWFFLTPIFFQPDTLSLRPAATRSSARCSTGSTRSAPFIEALRSILYYGTRPTWGRLLYAVVAAFVALGAGGCCSGAWRASWRWWCDRSHPVARSRPRRGDPAGCDALVQRPCRQRPDAQGPAARQARARARRRCRRCTGVTLHIEPGETVGMVGRNGAGKTSTLRVLAGIVPLQSRRGRLRRAHGRAARARRWLQPRLLRPREHLPPGRAVRLGKARARRADRPDHRASPSSASSSTSR